MKKMIILSIHAGLALIAWVSHADEPARAGNGMLEGQAESFGNWFGYDKKPTYGTRVKCPVMVGTFKVKDSARFTKYKGKWYAFCCQECKSKFDADPEKYLQACPPDCPCED